MLASDPPMDRDQVTLSSPALTCGNTPDPGPKGYGRASQMELSGETNIDSIRALDEEVRQLRETIIKIARTRNSLLNVSKLHPEILGSIFHWNVMLAGDFGGFNERSHNFLFVCHHWYQVALLTPELWSFWGNTPKDWARWHPRSKTAPLDLVLQVPFYGAECFDETLVGVLRDRASRDTIRRVHLESRDAALLNAVLSSLTPKGGEVRSNRMESFILWNQNVSPPVNVSGFFASYRFPKLQRLKLMYCKISLWDHLISATGALTDLCLDFTHSSPNPTTSQLLSLFASNPLLQRIKISHDVVPDGSDDISPSRVPLRHLRYLKLAGNVRHVLGLLDRLDHPEILNELAITLRSYTVAESSETIGPYLRDHFKHRDRSQSGLGLDVSFSNDTLTLHLGDVVAMDPEFVRMDRVLVLTIRGATARHLRREPKEVVLDFIVNAPKEEFVYCRALDEIGVMDDMYSWFPNLRTLHMIGVHLSTTFPSRDSGGDKATLPYLQNLVLENSVADDNCWGPLVAFLHDRASLGKRLGTLKLSHSSHMCLGVVESIKGVVRGFDAARDIVMCNACPFDACR